METFRRVKIDQQNSNVVLHKRKSPSIKTQNMSSPLKNHFAGPEVHSSSISVSNWPFEDELRKRKAHSCNQRLSSPIVFAEKCRYCHNKQNESTHQTAYSFSKLTHDCCPFNNEKTNSFSSPVISRKLIIQHEMKSDKDGYLDSTSLKRIKQMNLNIQPTSHFSYFSKAVESDLSNNLKSENNGIRTATNLINIDKYHFQNYHVLSNNKFSICDNLKVFVPAYAVLRGMFKNSIFIDDIKSLGPESFIVLSVICEKKFRVKIDKQQDSTGINKLATIIKSSLVEKRPEECKKIILSYTIKQLKHRLREKYSELYRKNTFEEFFYQYYFSHVAKDQGIPLEDFYYPIASTKCKKNSAKTINKTYLMNIKKSDMFMTDLREYINSDFVRDYGKEIDSKLFDLVNRWESEFKKSDCVEHLKSLVDKYFKDSKSKLPWTIYEIQFAIGKVRKILS